MRKLHQRCVRKPVFRTLAGSVVVCDPVLARQALVDVDGRLDHVPAFWRPGEVALPGQVRTALNRWVHTSLAAEDPDRMAATAVAAVAAMRGDLHRACLHAMAEANSGPLGLDHGLRPIVTAFLDDVFHAMVTGSRRYADTEAFLRLAARAGAAVADGAVPGLPDLDPAVRGEVYLRAVTAFVGASAAALAWVLCVLHPGELVATRRAPGPVRDAPAAHVALETLRLWPPAWQHRRPILQDHRVGDVKVLRGDELVVPAYALHRHPGHWTEPDVFDPARWTSLPGRPDAFLPFSTGPGACVGATFEVRWLTAVVAHLVAHDPIPLVRRGEDPCVTAVFSPPRHTIGD